MMQLLDTFKYRAVGHENVEPAIVVVVEESDATAGFLEQPALVRDAAKNVDCSAQTSLSGNICEMKSRQMVRTALGFLAGRGYRRSLKCRCVTQSRQQHRRGDYPAQPPKLPLEVPPRSSKAGASIKAPARISHVTPHP